jgi:hypothetical protein
VKLEFKHVPINLKLLAALNYFDNRNDAFDLSKYIDRKYDTFLYLLLTF